MHAMRFGWKWGTLLTLALPLVLAVSGCDEDDSEGDADSDAPTMAVEVEVCIAPGESAAEGETDESVAPEHEGMEVAEQLTSSGADE